MVVLLPGKCIATSAGGPGLCDPSPRCRVAVVRWMVARVTSGPQVGWHKSREDCETGEAEYIDAAPCLGSNGSWRLSGSTGAGGVAIGCRREERKRLLWEKSGELGGNVVERQRGDEVSACHSCVVRPPMHSQLPAENFGGGTMHGQGSVQ